jgi:heptaprenyl diphosphate synthase
MLLGYAETFVPIPLPGVKLGLANIAILTTLALDDLPGALCIAAIKVLAAGFLFGSPLTMAYAAAGTALSMLGMAPLSRLRTMRLWMISVVGSLLHETGQLMMASAILGTDAVWYLSPVLFIAGCATGVICGLLAQQLVGAFPSQEDALVLAQEDDVVRARPLDMRARVSFVALVVFVLVVLHLSNLVALLVCVGASLLSCLAARVPLRSMARATGPLVGIAVGSLALHLLVLPQDAAPATAVAVARLASITFASMAFMRLIPQDELSGTIAWLVSPLTRLGVRTQGFVLAFDVALRLLPVAAEVTRDRLRAQESPKGVRGLRETLLGLVQEVLTRVGA